MRPLTPEELEQYPEVSPEERQYYFDPNIPKDEWYKRFLFSIQAVPRVAFYMMYEQTLPAQTYCGLGLTEFTDKLKILDVYEHLRKVLPLLAERMWDINPELGELHKLMSDFFAPQDNENNLQQEANNTTLSNNNNNNNQNNDLSKDASASSVSNNSYDQMTITVLNDLIILVDKKITNQNQRTILKNGCISFPFFSNLLKIWNFLAEKKIRFDWLIVKTSCCNINPKLYESWKNDFQNTYLNNNQITASKKRKSSSPKHTEISTNSIELKANSDQSLHSTQSHKTSITSEKNIHNPKICFANTGIGITDNLSRYPKAVEQNLILYINKKLILGSLKAMDNTNDDKGYFAMKIDDELRNILQGITPQFSSEIYTWLKPHIPSIEYKIHLQAYTTWRDNFLTPLSQRTYQPTLEKKLNPN